MDTPPRFTGAGVVLAWMFRAIEGTSGWFTHSLVDFMRWDAQGPGHVCGGAGGFIDVQSGPRIAETRNQIVDQFATAFPNAEWLLFIDSDMTFDCTLVEDLLKAADPEHVPILGTLAFVAGGDQGGPHPTIFEEHEAVGPDGEKMVAVSHVVDYPKNALVKCGGTGASGLLIHRGVLAAMSQPWPKGFGTLENGRPNPYPWFSEGLVNPDGHPLGEDIAFCRRARLLDIPVHVHTGIKMGHMKLYKLDEDYYQRRLADEAQDKALATGDRAARRRAARAAVKARS